MSVRRIARNIFPEKLYRDLAVRRHNLLSARIQPQKFDGLLSYPTEGYSDCFHIESRLVANSFYGIEPALIEYSGYKGKVCAAIEHGVYFGRTIESEVTCNPYPGIITFGPQRRRHLRSRFDRLILEVGPFIHYCRSYLGDGELQYLKSSLGKTLLFFPKHSIEGVEIRADINETCRQIDSIKEQNAIKSVLVCLYFNDIPTPLPKLFEERGFTVVCCGHRSDPSFLPRQKSLIELSDITASNSVGTHIGYCHLLGKPHLLISQSISEKDYREDVSKDDETQRSRTCEMKEVEAAFSRWENGDEQKRVVKKYWGTGKLKTPEQLLAAFIALEEIYGRTRKKSMMVNAAKSIATSSSDADVVEMVEEMLG